MPHLTGVDSSTRPYMMNKRNWNLTQRYQKKFKRQGRFVASVVRVQLWTLLYSSTVRKGICDLSCLVSCSAAVPSNAREDYQDDCSSANRVNGQLLNTVRSSDEGWPGKSIYNSCSYIHSFGRVQCALKGKRTKTGIFKGNSRPPLSSETVKCTYDKPREPLHAVVTCYMEAVISQGHRYGHANMGYA